MSAPDTVLAKQKRRHRGPLVGMALLVAIALLFFLWFLTRAVDTEDTIDGDPAATAVEPAGSATEAPAESSPGPAGGGPLD